MRRYVYDGIGNPTAILRDIGGTQDRATGWVHFGNRWYNPTTGRLTQQDTLDAPLDSLNANRYAYAGGDPINNSDPSGQITCGWSLFFFAASFISLVGSLVSLALPLTRAAAGWTSLSLKGTIGSAISVGETCG